MIASRSRQHHLGFCQLCCWHRLKTLSQLLLCQCGGLSVYNQRHLVARKGYFAGSIADARYARQCLVSIVGRQLLQQQRHIVRQHATLCLDNGARSLYHHFRNIVHHGFHGERVFLCVVLRVGGYGRRNKKSRKE